jgi:hypothetical protein
VIAARSVLETSQAANASVHFIDGQNLPEDNKSLVGGDHAIALFVEDNASDDGFRIGRFTLSQKESLCLIRM